MPWDTARRRTTACLRSTNHWSQDRYGLSAGVPVLVVDPVPRQASVAQASNTQPAAGAVDVFARAELADACFHGAGLRRVNCILNSRKVLILDAPQKMLRRASGLGSGRPRRDVARVLHMVPPAGGAHQRLSSLFFLEERPSATRRVVWSRGWRPGCSEPTTITVCRIRMYYRPEHGSDRIIEGAELVVEVRSAGTRPTSMDFYARHACAKFWSFIRCTRPSNLPARSGPDAPSAARSADRERGPQRHRADSRYEVPDQVGRRFGRDLTCNPWTPAGSDAPRVLPWTADGFIVMQVTQGGSSRWDCSRRSMVRQTSSGCGPSSSTSWPPRSVTFLIERGVPDRRSPGAESGCGRADDRVALGPRLAARLDPLGHRHQAYVHKLLTGRASKFDRLRQSGGLSGYPSRAESEHDLVENSHASTALSYADGLAARATAARGVAPRGGGGGRRRRAHRRDGLGGVEQHRGCGPSRGDRGQRQRNVPTRRPSVGWPGTCRPGAHHAELRAFPALGRETRAAHPAGRQLVVQRVARFKKGVKDAPS